MVKKCAYFKGFTLAEVMIVLTVIGVLTAILLPVARQSMPDENLMKFKKAHNTLGTVIRELVTSDKYYKDGDLGVKVDGSLVEEFTYFCNSFADIVNVKRLECSEHISPEVYSEHIVQLGSDYGLSLPEAKEALDNACKKYAPIIGAEIELSDKIYYFQTHPNYPFGMKYKTALDNASTEENRNYCVNNPTQDICQDTFRLFGTDYFVDENGFDRIYKIFCIDIDGINFGEDPFGYGIRADGKILTGKRADEWLAREVNQD